MRMVGGSAACIKERRNKQGLISYPLLRRNHEDRYSFFDSSHAVVVGSGCSDVHECGIGISMRGLLHPWSSIHHLFLKPPLMHRPTVHQHSGPVDELPANDRPYRGAS